jgi:hypothetical protein
MIGNQMSPALQQLTSSGITLPFPLPRALDLSCAHALDPEEQSNNALGLTDTDTDINIGRQLWLVKGCTLSLIISWGGAVRVINGAHNCQRSS